MARGKMENSSRSRERFVTVLQEGGELQSGGIRTILVDRETGVQYLLIKTVNGSSITPILGSDGKPLLAQLIGFDEV